MAVSQPSNRRAAEVVSRVVIVVALYQGAVPLVVRPLFGADQRFAPALWLPAPWWWIACLAIVLAAAAVVVWLDGDDPEPASTTSADQGASAATGTARRSTWESSEGERSAAPPVAVYDTASAIVFLVGIYNGVAPFVSRLLLDGDLRLAFTLRLPAPWWWIASITVLVVAAGLLTVIDQAKERRFAERP